jgi:methylated-DNA-protein-cysteine methyltransferase-like protein
MPSRSPARRSHRRRAEGYAPFTTRALRILRGIPRGKVATYGLVAAAAGSPLGARQVVRILHSLSRQEKLPWHRVIGSRGSIRLPRGLGFETQRARLIKDGVKVSPDGRVDLGTYLWRPRLPEDD